MYEYYTSMNFFKIVLFDVNFAKKSQRGNLKEKIGRLVGKLILKF